MTIYKPVILDVGPKEFAVGVTYTGSSRSTEMENLAFDPMPSFNRVLKIFTCNRFREKEAEVTRRDRAMATRQDSG